MRLLLHQTLATLPLTLAFAEGWVDTGAGPKVEPMPALPAAAVGTGDAALLPTPEAALLMDSHLIVPGTAVIADGAGPVSLRTPVRPDAVERTPVRLLDVSSAAEVLARATLRPFYGIEPTGWVRDDAAPAQAVVAEGVESLRPAEGGGAEDLCRAFFILTGLPVVSHVLAVPAAAEGDAGPLVELLGAAHAASQERRREWRQPFVEREGIPREAFDAVLGAQRFALEPDDRRAMTALLSHGGRGTPYPTAPAWRFVDG